MKTILIDAVGINRSGGGRTSILNLLRQVFTQDTQNRYLLWLSAAEPELSGFANVQQIPVSDRNRFTVRLQLQAAVRSMIREERVDLVHFTKNLTLWGLPCPYVVTVHDLTALRLSEQHSRADVFYWRYVEPFAVRGAARVVAVSEDTARDVSAFYGVPPERVSVVPWAPHPRFVPVRDEACLTNLRARYGLPDRFILFLGILARKKNLPTLLRSLAQLRARRPDVPDLVVVGRQYPQSEDIVSGQMVGELGLAGHVHFVGNVPDADLPAFYSASEMYVLPSLHEGFGIPCLEAMACGTPVIVPATGALPEVVADAALIYGDPRNATALCVAIERVLSDPGLRNELIDRGFQRAGQFSWPESGRQMLNVYRNLLGGGSG